MPQMSMATADAHASEKLPEVLFEDYQILEELPPGGQATVYKAIHRPTKTTVALKVLPAGQHASKKARWHFEREVELIASLDHPNIVSIRDSGITRGQYYFSMEYIHGQSLDQYVKSRSLALREKMLLFSRIGEAMTHAHQRGVIHRDIKPSNIMVDERGEPHMLDFGLAKAAGSWGAISAHSVMPSVTGQLKGTLAYMSPEQAAGHSSRIDVRSDVYSLGVVLYEILMGKLPYDVTGSTFEVLENIQKAEPMRPRQIISRFDSDVEAVIVKALAKDRNERYQSATELRHDVECWLKGLPIVARSVSSLYLLRKIVARHSYTSAIVGLLFVIITGNSIISLHFFGRSRQSLRILGRNQAESKRLSERRLTFANQVVFTTFLELWHDGKMQRATNILHSFDRESQESLAARFLLDDRPLGEKQADFQGRLSTKSRAFWNFVLAEYFLKEGDKEGNNALAVKALTQCSKLSQKDSELDDWFINRARAQLQHLQGMPSPDPNAGGD